MLKVIQIKFIFAFSMFDWILLSANFFRPFAAQCYSTMVPCKMTQYSTFTLQWHLPAMKHKKMWQIFSNECHWSLDIHFFDVKSTFGIHRTYCRSICAEIRFGHNWILFFKKMNHHELCPLSVCHPSIVNFSHFQLLLWNRLTEFAKTW